MFRSTLHENHGNGSDKRRNNQDYNTYVKEIERMTSTYKDVPRFPNLFRVFKNHHSSQNSATGDEPIIRRKPYIPVTVQREHVEDTKKVLVSGTGGNRQSNSGGVDIFAEEYIKKKHKNLETQRLMSLGAHEVPED